MSEGNLYQKVESGGYTLKVFYDTMDANVSNPRTEWDNMGHMTCFHNNYQNGLGDEHDYNTPEQFLKSLCDEFDIKYDDYEDEIDDLIKKIDKSDKVIMLPVNAYEHGSITISTGSFSCPWDSGQIGWIYVTKAEVREEYSVKRVTKKTYDKAVDLLKAEIAVFDQYLQGDVYGFVLEDSKGEHVDSVWGFYGTDWKTNGMFDDMSIDKAILNDLREQLD